MYGKESKGRRKMNVFDSKRNIARYDKLLEKEIEGGGKTK